MKPLLVGESNPFGGDPYYALYPSPDGCSGHRLCLKILGMHRKDYLDSFDRVNLCVGKWSIGNARQEAQLILAEGRRTILFGSKVFSAFSGVPFAGVAFRTWTDNLLVLPHPSGLCRSWSEPGAFLRAREAVAAFLPEIAPLLGKV